MIYLSDLLIALSEGIVSLKEKSGDGFRHLFVTRNSEYIKHIGGEEAWNNQVPYSDDFTINPDDFFQEWPVYDIISREVRYIRPQFFTGLVQQVAKAITPNFLNYPEMADEVLVSLPKKDMSEDFELDILHEIFNVFIKNDVPVLNFSDLNLLVEDNDENPIPPEKYTFMDSLDNNNSIGLSVESGVGLEYTTIEKAGLIPLLQGETIEVDLPSGEIILIYADIHGETYTELEHACKQGRPFLLEPMGDSTDNWSFVVKNTNKGQLVDDNGRYIKAERMGYITMTENEGSFFTVNKTQHGIPAVGLQVQDGETSSWKFYLTAA